MEKALVRNLEDLCFILVSWEILLQLLTCFFPFSFLFSTSPFSLPPDLFMGALGALLCICMSGGLLGFAMIVLAADLSMATPVATPVTCLGTEAFPSAD